MTEKDTHRWRVAILGTHPELAEWASLVSGSGDAEYVTDVAELLASGADLALVFADPQEAALVSAKVASSPDPPPLAIMVGRKDQPHPHWWLMRTLAQAKRAWEVTFDAIVDPVAILDTEGSITRANLGLAKALGRSIKETIGAHYRDLLGSPSKGSRDAIAEALADGRPRTQEVQFSNLPGLQQITTSPLETPDGVRGLVVILKDVSEIKNQQEQLLRSARLADIGQLAAGVAHEINTPLASIALRAESLLKSAEDPRLHEIPSFKNFSRYLKTIDEEIFRCKRIIGALLEFSRTQRPETRKTDLNLLVERAADLVGHQVKLKQVALDLRLEPGLLQIEADEGQLRQVLIALLMNALDATTAGGRISIETRGDAKGVSLAISDDGVGIPPEHMDKIFSPFFTTKPTGQGTGLGLAICHGIVSSHGGRIEVESEAGRGTRISVRLPLRDPSAHGH